MIFIDPHRDQFLKSDLYRSDLYWSALTGLGDCSCMSRFKGTIYLCQVATLWFVVNISDSTRTEGAGVVTTKLIALVLYFATLSRLHEWNQSFAFCTTVFIYHVQGTIHRNSLQPAAQFCPSFPYHTWKLLITENVTENTYYANSCKQMLTLNSASQGRPLPKIWGTRSSGICQFLGTRSSKAVLHRGPRPSMSTGSRLQHKTALWDASHLAIYGCHIPMAGTPAAYTLPTL